ncbi:MAG TPA: alpha/beta fold hydrolase [Tepidisphaeraceae bacterium]|nr:alpha/beta fold hydrolase [Tepidisphaeraceae bacterium]
MLIRPQFHCVLLAAALLLTAARSLAGMPTTQPIAGTDTQPLIIHLPGIGGHRFPDEMVKQGLSQAGLGAEIYIYDWTGEDEGFNALTNVARHQSESAIVAALITTTAREQPNRRIIITCHSGGAGIAAWALAQLPEGVMIDAWLMLAPALSPRFDLSPSLARVRGNAYSFNSSRDPVLGFGTRNFGTVDRVRTDAAGRVGFEMPTHGDAKQYEKLHQLPYNADWRRHYNSGDHIGATMRPFVRSVIAPLLAPATQPAAAKQ